MLQKFYSLFLLVLILSATQAAAQKQLLLLKREKVILRLYPGDDFVYRLKNSKRIKSSYVNNINQTTVFTHRDTVPFHTIDRIYFRQVKFYNRLGAKLIAGGILLFAIDQLNETVIQGNKASLDNGVTSVSIGLVAAGLPMVLIRKKSQRLNYKFRLIMVERGSIFYKDPPNGFSSPYIN